MSEQTAGEQTADEQATGEPTLRKPTLCKPTTGRLVFADDFDAAELDCRVWLPHYLPAWSSREASAATYEIADSGLRLRIPPAQGLWCGDDHAPPTRVSGIQSGNFSGPVGSTIGQQPYRDGLTVREEQETFWGWTPAGGQIECRARAVLTPNSMVAFWMVGLEDRPERSAEICVAEIFADAVKVDESGDGSAGVKSAAVGMGLHSFRDPAVTEDFEAVRLPIDVTEFHTYAVDWNAERAEFLVDGELVRTCPAPPSYPMQLMLAVFDFPDPSTAFDGTAFDGTASDGVPELIIDYIRGYAAGPDSD